MNTADLFSLCARNLLRRRTRTVLAITGVVVGVCAIIVMLSIGFGLTESYEAMISSYGNLHLITVYNYNSGNQDVKLNDAAIASFEAMEGVGAVTPIISAYGTIVDENTGKLSSLSIKGIDADVLEKFNYSCQEGSLLKKSDPSGILFGNDIPNWFYDPESDDWGGDPLDVMKADLYLTMDTSYGYSYYDSDSAKRPDYPMHEIHATGVLSNPSDESAYSVYMDINALEEIIASAQAAEEGTDYEGNTSSGTTGEGANKTYNQVYIYVDDIKNTDTISQTIKDLGYQTYSSSDWLNEAKSTLKMIELVLGGIGGISLFVAAIGIANTMIMSVYERTKEIGIMKVIGANIRDIRNMFLIEAGMIGAAGGLIGIALSFGISFAMNHFLSGLMSSFLGYGSEGSRISVIPLWLVFAALGFSFLVGVVAGFSPANKACKTSALESLRNE